MARTFLTDSPIQLRTVHSKTRDAGQLARRKLIATFFGTAITAERRGLIFIVTTSLAAEGVRTVVATTSITPSQPAQMGASHESFRVAVSCSSRDGSRTCSCDTKCHRTEDDCECEDN